MAFSEPAAQIQMHRQQATTKDASGWYLGVSTQGAFSILLPVPFNDFTMYGNDPTRGPFTAYRVATKSVEGLGFSATEKPLVFAPQDLNTLPITFEKSGFQVSDVDNSPFAGYPAETFSIENPSGGKFVRYVKTPKSFIFVVLEYPLNQKPLAESVKTRFLNSLRIPSQSEAEDMQRLKAAVTEYCATLQTLDSSIAKISSAEETIKILNFWSESNEKLVAAMLAFAERNPLLINRPQVPAELASAFDALTQWETKKIPQAVAALVRQYQGDPQVLAAFQRLGQSIKNDQLDRLTNQVSPRNP